MTPGHQELELKAVISDPDAFRERLRAAGAVPRFSGRMTDLRYDRAGELASPRRGAAGADLPPPRRGRSHPGLEGPHACARPRATSCARRSSCRSPARPPIPGGSSPRWDTSRCTPSSATWRSTGSAGRPRGWRPTLAWTCSWRWRETRPPSSRRSRRAAFPGASSPPSRWPNSSGDTRSAAASPRCSRPGPAPTVGGTG